MLQVSWLVQHILVTCSSWDLKALGSLSSVRNECFSMLHMNSNNKIKLRAGKQAPVVTFQALVYRWCLTDAHTQSQTPVRGSSAAPRSPALGKPALHCLLEVGGGTFLLPLVQGCQEPVRPGKFALKPPGKALALLIWPRTGIFWGKSGHRCCPWG